ncbi:MAG: FHA domain-containing protein, partial [Xanthomonadales bacterium]|nr:FHA domain-containing protein [Xanthomonadales bacterium]
MKCRLTTVRRSSGGGESRRSSEFETSVVRIGRGTDQDIHVPDLNVALNHARLTAVGHDRYALEVLSRNGVRVNGRRQQDGTLRIGD